MDIAPLLVGRTPNSVKNRYNATLIRRPNNAPAGIIHPVASLEEGDGICTNAGDFRVDSYSEDECTLNFAFMPPLPSAPHPLQALSDQGLCTERDGIRNREFSELPMSHGDIAPFSRPSVLSDSYALTAHSPGPALPSHRAHDPISANLVDMQVGACLFFTPSESSMFIACEERELYL